MGNSSQLSQMVLYNKLMKCGVRRGPSHGEFSTQLHSAQGFSQGLFLIVLNVWMSLASHREFQEVYSIEHKEHCVCYSDIEQMGLKEINPLTKSVWKGSNTDSA